MQTGLWLKYCLGRFLPVYDSFWQFLKEETVINRFLTVYTDVCVKTGFWRHKPNPAVASETSIHIYDVITYAHIDVNDVPSLGWPKEFWCRKGLSVRINTLTWLPFTVRLPFQKIYISTICNVRMSERIAVVSVPCIVRHTSVIWLGGGQDSLDRCFMDSTYCNQEAYYGYTQMVMNVEITPFPAYHEYCSRGFCASHCDCKD